MAHQRQHGEHGKKECKCKLLPLSLSANTAAEFGDLASLTHRLSSSKYQRGQITAPPVVKTPPPSKHNGSSPSTASATHTIGITHNTSTPLHLAAQNGHAAITAYLLQNGYGADTGHRRCSGTRSTNTNASSEQMSKQKIPTPLHRACHSGALSSIKLLLENGANDMAIDYSIGDEMTPLHKAVKGGRYLAVALLLDHFKKKVNGNSSENDGMNDEKYLIEALEARDKSNRTPLDLALELQSHGEEEVLSVRRWDSVAGGSADWDNCVQLLRDASSSHGGIDNIGEFEFSSQRPAVEKEKEEDGSRKKNDYYSSKYTLMCNCNDVGEGDKCKTLMWESAFNSYLLQSTTALIKKRPKEAAKMKTIEPLCVEIVETDKIQESNVKFLNPQENTNTMEIDINTTSPKTVNALGKESKRNQDVSPTTTLGQPCQNCNLNTINLFRSKTGQLVCRKCIKASRRRRRS